MGAILRMVASMRLYEELGVPSSATDAEIRSAFRRRALQVHPDKSGDEAAFKRLNDAYGVLSDPERRSAYDRHGDNPHPHQQHQHQHQQQQQQQHGFGFQAFFNGGVFPGNPHHHHQQQKQQQPEIDSATITVSLSEAYHGCTRSVSMTPMPRACSACEGTGYRPSCPPARRAAQCNSCGGRGEVNHHLGPFVVGVSGCGDCRGSGKAPPPPGLDCETCRGERSVVRQPPAFNMVVPPGGRHSHDVPCGGSFDPKAGKDRDLKVETRLSETLPDGIASVDFASGLVCMTVRVPLPDLLSGFERTLSPWGRPLRVRSSGYFRPTGRTLSVPNLGLPPNGELRVSFEVDFPDAMPTQPSVPDAHPEAPDAPPDGPHQLTVEYA